MGLRWSPQHMPQHRVAALSGLGGWVFVTSVFICHRTMETQGDGIMASFRTLIGPRDDHLKAIGLVAVHWSFLELALSSLIWEMTPVKQMRAQAITTHLNERMRGDIARALAHEIFPGHALETRLIDLIGEIMDKLYSERNMVVHGLWGPCGDTAKIAIQPVKARGAVKVGPVREFTAEDIEQIAARIETAHIALTRLGFEISAYLQTLKSWP